MPVSALLLALLTPAVQSTSPVSVGPATPAAPTAARFVGLATAVSGRPAVELREASSGRDVSFLLDPRLRRPNGIRFEPLDDSRRTELTEQLPLAARLRPEGLAGLVLPGGQGTLHRYVRGGQPEREGILHVAPDGRPRIAFEVERPGPSTPALVDTAGVGPQGRGALIATTPAAGGRLVELDLAGRVALERGGAPADYTGRGLHLGAAFGFGVTPAAVLRFARGAAGPAAGLPLAGGGAPSFPGDATMSPRGAFAVVLADTGGGLGVPYAFGPSGPAVPTSNVPLALAGAGHARETTFGPYLAITDDGRTVAWRVDDHQDPATLNVGNEVFVQRAGLPFDAVAASGDAFVLDTISEVGRVLSAAGGGVQFFVGEPNDPTEGGLESADLFRARMDPTGALTLENLSSTMSDTTSPYTSGTAPLWTPARQVLVTPTVMLLHEDDGKALLRLDLETGAHQTVLPLVREVAWIEALDGGAWCAAIERDTPGRERQLVGAPSAGAPAVVLDPGTPVSLYEAPRTLAGTLVCLRTDLGQESLVAVRPALGAVDRLPDPGGFELPLGLIGEGTVLATRRGVGQNEPLVWELGGGARSLGPAAPALRILR